MFCQFVWKIAGYCQARRLSVHSNKFPMLSSGPLETLEGFFDPVNPQSSERVTMGEIAIVTPAGLQRDRFAYQKSSHVITSEFFSALGADPENPTHSLDGIKTCHKMSMTSDFATENFSFSKNSGCRPRPVNNTKENSYGTNFLLPYAYHQSQPGALFGNPRQPPETSKTP